MDKDVICGMHVDPKKAAGQSDSRPVTFAQSPASESLTVIPRSTLTRSETQDGMNISGFAVRFFFIRRGRNTNELL